MSQLKIGLALSGGGFRATLFHLGVIRALRQYKVPGLPPNEDSLLHCITHITSVSGGSVIAAHFALHAQKYLGSDDEFQEITEDLISLAGGDMRGNIVRGIPALMLLRTLLRLIDLCPSWVFRPAKRNTLQLWIENACTTYQLEKRFKEALFGEAKLKDLPETPHLFVLGTNVNDRCLCSFSRDGFQKDTLAANSRPIRKDVITVAEAVTASACFPGLFRPLNLERSHMATYKRRTEISDAGVYDNLGVSKLRAIASQNSLDYVFVSDATKGILCDTLDAQQPSASEVKPPTFLSNLFLSTDLIHNRTKQLQEEITPETPIADLGITRPSYIYFRISKDGLNSDPCLASVHQPLLKLIRTDFDKFNSTETRSLALHGFCVTCHRIVETLQASGLVTAAPCNFQLLLSTWPNPPPRQGFWRRSPENVHKIESRLIDGAVPRWRIFSLRDKDSLFHMIAAILAALGIAVAYYLILSQIESAEPTDPYSRALKAAYPRTYMVAVSKIKVVQDLNQLLSRKTNELSASETQINNLKTNLYHLNIDFDKTSNTLEKTMQIASSLQAERARLEVDLGANKAQLAISRSNSDAFLTQASRLGDDLAASATRLNTLLPQVAKLESDVKQASAKSELLESQLQSAVQAYMGACQWAMPTGFVRSVSERKEPGDIPPYDGFAFLSIDKVFDLRAWTNVPPDSTNAFLEPANVLMRYHLKRSAFRREIQFPFKSSGEVFPFAMPPFDQDSEVTWADLERGLTLRRMRRLWINLDKVPPNTEFDVWAGATYWNSFQSNRWWAGFVAFGDIHRGSLGVLFPANKPQLGCQVMTTTNGGPLDWKATEEYRFKIETPNSIYVSLERPKPYLIYAIHWKW